MGGGREIDDILILNSSSSANEGGRGRVCVSEKMSSLAFGGKLGSTPRLRVDKLRFQAERLQLDVQPFKAHMALGETDACRNARWSPLPPVFYFHTCKKGKYYKDSERHQGSLQSKKTENSSGAPGIPHR